MSCLLQVTKHHYTTEVSDMQTVCSGVNTHVCRDCFLLEKFFCSGHHLVNHAPPFKFLYKIHTDNMFYGLQSYTLSF